MNVVSSELVALLLGGKSKLGQEVKSDRWLAEKRSCILFVPSIVAPLEGFE